VNIVAQKTLTIAFQTIITAPAEMTVSSILITNGDTNPWTVRLCVTPTGESPTLSNSILWDFSIAANDFIEIGSGQIIPSSYSIQASAQTNNRVNIRLSAV